MEGTVVQTHFHIAYRVTGKYTVHHRLLETLFNRRNIFPRNGSADDLVHELQAALTFIHRGDFHREICEFTTTTGLLLVRFTVSYTAGNRFLVRYLRRSWVTFSIGRASCREIVFKY